MDKKDFNRPINKYIRIKGKDKQKYNSIFKAVLVEESEQYIVFEVGIQPLCSNRLYFYKKEDLIIADTLYELLEEGDLVMGFVILGTAKIRYSGILNTDKSSTFKYVNGVAINKSLISSVYTPSLDKKVYNLQEVFNLDSL